jgi:hypothetical protein
MDKTNYILNNSDLKESIITNYNKVISKFTKRNQFLIELLSIENLYFLKGVYFIDELDIEFKELGSRFLNTIDIIIEEEMLDKIKTFLLDNDFILFLSSGKKFEHYYFMSKYLGISIVIHLNKSRSYYINKVLKSLYDEIKSVSYSYFSLKVIKPEFLIIYSLIFIFVNDQLNYDKYLFEIEKNINLYGKFINWDRFANYIIENNLVLPILKLLDFDREITKFIPIKVINILKKNEVLFIEKLRYKFLI